MNEPQEMNESIVTETPKLSEFYDGNNRAGSVERIKFWLMPFVFFALLGFPITGVFGKYVVALSNFTGLAFFLFCGFFTLTPDPAKCLWKLTRAVKRTGLLLLILFVSYILLNLAYLAYIGALKSLLSPELLRWRTLFNFLVLNLWPLPMGSAFWFVQSLFYAYVFFFLVEKLKLSKLYLPILVVAIVFMLLSGEFAKIVHFSILGYRYIPGGFLTKALPFMLIGMLIRKYIDKLSRVPQFVFLITFAVGILFAVGELFLLDRFGLLATTGNTIGYAIMAISICCFAFVDPDIGDSFLGSHGGNYARRMYACCQPVALLLWMGFRIIHPDLLETVTQLQSVICFALCLALAFLLGWTKFSIAFRKGDIEIEENEKN